MAQWKEGGWSRRRVAVPRLFSSTGGTGAGEQFFLLESLGITPIWRQTRRAEIPKHLWERGVIPWFHLFSSYPNPPGCAGAQWHELCVPSDVPCCAHSSLWECRDAFQGIHHCRGKEVYSHHCVPSTGLPPAGKLLWRWSFLLPVSFQTHFTASYSCVALLGPFSCCSSGWGTPGRNNLCSGPAQREAGASLTEQMQGHWGLRAEGLCSQPRPCCPQGCASTGTAASRGIAPWHRPGCAMGLMQLGDRSVDFTRIEKDSDFDLNPSVIIPSIINSRCL